MTLEHTLYEERKPTQELIERFKIPNGTLAELSGVFRSEVSRYTKNKAVSKPFCVAIEKTVEELAYLLSLIKEHTGFWPDMKDLDSLRDGISELRSVRNRLQIGLEAATLDVQKLFSEMASGS